MDDDQQFCLRWNNHQSTLVAVFDTLLERDILVDCTLAAEGKCLNAHKVVLSACSPFFESVFSRHYDKHPILVLKDVKFQELKAMMDYMYRGEVNISQDQLGALLKAAESLQIKGLSDNRKSDVGPQSERRTTASAASASTAQPASAKSPQPSGGSSLVGGGVKVLQDMKDDTRDEHLPIPRKKRMRRMSDEIEPPPLQAAQDGGGDSAVALSNIPTTTLPFTSATTPHNTAITTTASNTTTNTDVPIDSVEAKPDMSLHHGGGGGGGGGQSADSVMSSSQVSGGLEDDDGDDTNELMLEPKSEQYDDNDDSVEDLTLDDDDDMSNMDVGMDVGAGPSHGNGSNQGFTGWHASNQSQDHVFLAAQEAIGSQRDSQGGSGQLPVSIVLKDGISEEEHNVFNPWLMWANEEDSLKMLQMQQQLQLQQQQQQQAQPKRKSTPSSNRIRGNFCCPQCGRNYIRKDSLQRHLTYECGKEPQFQCPFCPQKCKRKAHRIRHITRQHKDKIAILEENNPDLILRKDQQQQQEQLDLTVKNETV